MVTQVIGCEELVRRAVAGNVLKIHMCSGCVYSSKILGVTVDQAGVMVFQLCADMTSFSIRADECLHAGGTFQATLGKELSYLGRDVCYFKLVEPTE